MSIEKRYSLRSAAVMAGMDRKTIRRRLEVELGLVFPKRRRGQNFYIRESDLERLMRLGTPYPDWSRLRGPKSARSRVS